MRISMPLFWFDLKGIDIYSINDSGISISPFKEDDIPQIPLFSEQDVRHIKNEAPWTLIYESADIEGYKTKINVLLLAFKIFCKKRYPFIKYRLCRENHAFCRRLNDTITYNYSHPRATEKFTADDLDNIKEGFLSLIEMDQVSIRTHNALYFLYRAWHSTQWMDSFILLMCSLESLFSKDKSGGATATITTRVSSLLGSKERCTKKDIEDLYGLRSRMTHGNIRVSDDPGDNLTKLHHLDFVVVECFKTIAIKKMYKHFSDKASRDKFMSTLNTST